MIRVTITGSESTGKTTLARALAGHYDARWVPEYARRFVEERGRAPGPGDVEAIARGQMESEDAATELPSRLLVLDTDLLSTVVYAWHYYGRCPSWIEAALAARAPDLYLLAGLDVPWAADGPHRDRGEAREEMQALFRDALVARRLPFREVGGPVESRVADASGWIDPLLGSSGSR